MNNRQILLVDDTKALAEMYALALGAEGYQVTTVHTGATLFETIQNASFAPDLLILDVKLPDIDGLDLLAKLKSMGFDAPVIVITGHGSIHMAVDAMRIGAADFLVKPFPIEKLTDSVSRALESVGLSTKANLSDAESHLDDLAITTTSQKPTQQRSGFGGFIGISPPMQVVYDIIENAAKSSATVFITGESGTGKEICAEAIHAHSRRAGKPFIAINCAAIPRELLESELFGHTKGAFTGAHSEREGAVAQANGGTLFLDEIAEMAPDMQTKLLRFLQNLTYRKIGGSRLETANVRIICATNKDPLDEIKNGYLRQDLYYRLHVIPIHMPPLRQRPTDIIDLADYFLRLYSREENKSFRSFSPDAEHILTSCTWPGNVRQLQNIVRGIAVLHDGKTVAASMIPTALQAERNLELLTRPPSPMMFSADLSPSEIGPLWKIERDAIETAIAKCEGNIPRAAAMLEISPSTIYRKKMLWDKHPHGGAQTLGSGYFHGP